MKIKTLSSVPSRSIQGIRENLKNSFWSMCIFKQVSSIVQCTEVFSLTVAPVSGILIKNVLEGSPAGDTGQLCSGDRILEVDGVDLRNGSLDEAIKFIRKSSNKVTLVVQHMSRHSEGNKKCWV